MKDSAILGNRGGCVLTHRNKQAAAAYGILQWNQGVPIAANNIVDDDGVDEHFRVTKTPRAVPILHTYAECANKPD